jgi:Recombination, repair and ssDNA binding protein UvsY
MKLEEIQNLWDADSQIDRSELGDESLRIVKMHAKYFKIYSQERLLLRKMESDLKELYRDKYEWYNGNISKELLEQRGWEPNPLKILRTDVAMYISADEVMRTASLRVELQNEKVLFLESIIKSLSTLGYNIKNAIEWSKFQNGT